MEIKAKITAKPKDFAMFMVFAIFLLYLVAIGVLNLYYIAQKNVLWGFNPFPAFSKDFIVSTLTFYILAIIAVISSASSTFFDKEKGFGFGKKKDKEDPGYSRWFKDDEMKKAYNVKKITLSDETYEHGGIPIILDEKNAWVDDGENHSLIIGASGSGKTWTIIDPQVKILGKAGESMIITDPKGEIYENNANMLREKGYNIVLLNFRDPSHGNAWNPLSLPYRFYKEGNVAKAMELVDDLANNILKDPNVQGDTFWQNTAADYFTGLALGLFEDAKDESEVNINSINLMSTQGDERKGAKKYDLEYFKLKGEASTAFISASATVTAPADTKGGVTSTFKTKVRIFSSNPELSEMLSYTDFDMSKIGKEKTAVFLTIHDEKTTYHALMTILIKQLYEVLIAESRKNENLKLKVRTNFILDEFPNMPALKDVESMITASRSRNIRFTFGIQNFSQLNKVYGKDIAETIKGNCGNMFYLITTEYAALEELSKLLGDVKPKEAKEGKPQDPIRPLVTVSDLQQMKKFEMIIKRWRNQPYKTKHTPSFEIFKSKKGGWGYEASLSGYPTREKREIKLFNLKEFVDSHMEEDTSNPFGGFGPNPFMPSFPPQGMSKTSGITNEPQDVDDLIKRIDEQIAKIEEEEKTNKDKAKDSNEFEDLINKKYEEFTNVKESPKEEIKGEVITIEPVKESDNKFDVDDIISKIDARIKELEEEDNNYVSNEIDSKEDKIFTEVSEEISNDIIEDELVKPTINIDKDSIVYDENITDDEFFDDFFGEDE